MTKIQRHASELMPRSETALRVLKARAEQLARLQQDECEHNGIAYVRFRLGAVECYGIAYQYVHEILQYVTVSKPPCVPDFIAGVINWRGSLITVVDLVKFFHPTRIEQSGEFIIVINVNDITLGLLVKHVEGSDIYQLEQLGVPLISANVANAEYILGLDRAVTAILNIDTLVPGLTQEIKKSIYRIGDVHGNC